MADKKKKVELKIKLNDLPEDLKDEELEKVAGGILASEHFQAAFKSSALKRTIKPGGALGADSGYCDCWSYTARRGMPGGDVINPAIRGR